LVKSSDPNCGVLLSQTVPVLTGDEAVSIILSLQDEMSRLTSVVGLASPQIGISTSVAIIRHAGVCLNLINPSIVWGERPFISKREGCMSLPGRKFDVERFGTVKIRNYLLWPSMTGTVSLEDNINIRPIDRMKPPKGMFLVPVESVYVVENPEQDCGGIITVGVQHEIDHLSGVILEKKKGSIEVPSLDDPKWKVGRNDPCPCGSKLKFKKCCLPKL
jgi:peptide deformylase